MPTNIPVDPILVYDLTRDPHDPKMGQYVHPIASVDLQPIANSNDHNINLVLHNLDDPKYTMFVIKMHPENAIALAREILAKASLH